ESLSESELVNKNRQATSHDGACDQCDVRRLERGMGLGEKVREVPGAGERIRVAPVRVDDREEARDQTQQSDGSQQRGSSADTEHGIESVKQRRSRRAQRLCPATDGRVQQERQRSEDDK